MISHRQELWFEIPERMGFRNITPDVEEALRDSGVQEGLVLVNTIQPGRDLRIVRTSGGG